MGRHIPQRTWTAHCEQCDKHLYPSRNAAKLFLRRNPHTGNHPSVYHCPVRPGMFHIGNLAKPIVKGHTDRGTIYARPLTHARGENMQTYTTETPTPRSGRTQADNLTANRMMDSFLRDLTTYRYETQVPVTPSLARRLVDLNVENNRSLTARRVEQYARDMRNGRWVEKTGQSIKIDVNGRIIDGNHRMHSVVDSGKTIVFDIAFGIDPDAMPVIDSGKPRSNADVIRVAGGTDMARTAALVRWAWAWKQGGYTGAHGNLNPTPLEIREAYEADALTFDTAARRGQDCQVHGVGAGTPAALAYYLFATIDKGEADEFFDALVSGIYGVPDPNILAVYHLRERLIRRKTDRLTRQEQLALTIIAWNRRGEVVKKFQISRDAGDGRLTVDNFPQPNGTGISKRGRAVARLADQA